MRVGLHVTWLLLLYQFNQKVTYQHILFKLLVIKIQKKISLSGRWTQEMIWQNENSGSHCRKNEENCLVACDAA
jgi:hypothetical protein